MTISVNDQGSHLEFSFDDLMRYHGPGSPGGVAHAYKVMERSFPLLAPVERSQITIHTAFGGPGARDGFELVSRAVTGGRYVLDPSLSRPDLGATREKFVFVVGQADVQVTCALREGFVKEEFVRLLATEPRNQTQAARLEVLKREMAERLMAHSAHLVYDVV